MSHVASDTHSTLPTPVHQDFRWLTPAAQEAPLSRFLETTYDLAKGLHTCLQIVHASELEHAANQDADPGTAAAPAVSRADADNLLRLSITVSGMLQDEAQRRIDAANVAAVVAV